MSSLAALAHAAAPAAPAFNSTFYATVATVIPVLFLALAIQSQSYQGVLNAALRLAPGFQRGDRTARRALRTFVALRLLWGAYGFLLAAVVGEVLALSALYLGREPAGVRPTVYVAAIVLVLAAAAGPTVTLVKDHRAVMNLLLPQRAPAAPGATQDDSPSGPAGARASADDAQQGPAPSTPPPESGGTDTEGLVSGGMSEAGSREPPGPEPSP